MSEKNQKRNLNIDLIKVLAVFLVVLVHFFNRTGYYGLPSRSPLMLFATFIWSVAMACVPLFLIATGYLMKNAKYSKKFFTNLLRVVGYYAAAVVVLTITDKQAHGFGLIRVFFENLFTFNHYSWYVNMYIGLYLMSPMLNAAFESLKTKKNQLTPVPTSYQNSIQSILQRIVVTIRLITLFMSKLSLSKSVVSSLVHHFSRTLSKHII